MLSNLTRELLDTKSSPSTNATYYKSTYKAILKDYTKIQESKLHEKTYNKVLNNYKLNKSDVNLIKMFVKQYQEKEFKKFLLYNDKYPFIENSLYKDFIESGVLITEDNYKVLKASLSGFRSKKELLKEINKLPKNWKLKNMLYRSLCCYVRLSDREFAVAHGLKFHEKDLAKIQATLSKFASMKFDAGQHNALKARIYARSPLTDTQYKIVNLRVGKINTNSLRTNVRHI